MEQAQQVGELSLTPHNWTKGAAEIPPAGCRAPTRTALLPRVNYRIFRALTYKGHSKLS